MSRLTEMFRFQVFKPRWSFFDVLPRITLVDFENTFSVYLGFLWFNGEFMYIKKFWRGGAKMEGDKK